MIAALHDLKSANRAYFVKLLKELRKNKGVSITDLREQLADLDDGPVDFGDQEPAAKKLLRLVEATNAHFFTAAFLGDEEKPFVDFTDAKGHRVTALVNSKTARRWLASLYYRAEREGVSEVVLATVLLTRWNRALSSRGIGTRSMYVSASWTASSTSTSATRPGRRSRSTRWAWRIVPSPPVPVRALEQRTAAADTRARRYAGAAGQAAPALMTTG